MHLHYQKLGAGRPLAILHGLLGSSDNWLPLARSLADEFAVFALDLRNHGRSPHAAEFTYDAMVEDVREFLETHRLAQISLVGHSLGGKVAMHFALRFPERIKRLIVVDMAPRAYPPQHVLLFQALLNLDLSRFNNRTEIDAALAASIPDAPVRQFLLKNLVRTDTGAFAWKIPLEMIYQNYHSLNHPIESAHSFPHPALFIRGGRSDYIRNDDRPEIQRLFPRSEIVTIASAGHWVHADAPMEFSNAVRQFLSVS